MQSTIRHAAPSRRTPEKIALVCLFALISSVFEARAANLVSNGTFTSTSGTFASTGGGINTLESDAVTPDYTGGGSLTNWTVVDVGTATGLAFLYNQGNQGSTTTNGVGISQTGRFSGTFSLFDPGNVAGATPTGGAIPNTSPGGGNFIVADGATGFNVAIYQTLTNLTQGATYSLSFWYAAGQQSNRTGTTTEGWQVSFGNSAITTQGGTASGTTVVDTPAQPGGQLAQGSFQAWALDTFSFTATSATQILTFLSMGTPSGEPPADLLSDIVLTSVPEPASMAISGIGMASLIGLLWFRKNRVRKVNASSGD